MEKIPVTVRVTVTVLSKMNSNTKNNMVCLLKEINLLRQDFTDIGITLVEENKDKLTTTVTIAVVTKVVSVVTGLVGGVARKKILKNILNKNYINEIKKIIRESENIKIISDSTSRTLIKECIKELNLYIREQAPAPLWSLLNEYLEMRKEIGAPLTMRGLKMLLTRVEKLSDNNISVQRLMLENATQNQWKNVYRPKDQEIKAALDAQTNELKSFYGI